MRALLLVQAQARARARHTLEPLFAHPRLPYLVTCTFAPRTSHLVPPCLRACIPTKLHPPAGGLSPVSPAVGVASRLAACDRRLASRRRLAIFGPMGHRGGAISETCISLSAARRFAVRTIEPWSICWRSRPLCGGYCTGLFCLESRISILEVREREKRETALQNGADRGEARRALVALALAPVSPKAREGVANRRSDEAAK